MADPTPVAVVATPVPKSSDIKRAEKFTRESFVHAGESTADALAPGTARRRAFDAALLEIEAGEKVPSTNWRRRYSLMLGLERVLSDDEPKLADGTSLNPHQVDALSGTLTALLAEAQRNGAHTPAPAAAPVLALDDDEPDDSDFAVSAAAADDEDDEPDDDLDRLRVRLTPEATRAFIDRARRVVAAGRPPCPLCGQPLDPAGHLCPRHNGYHR